MKLPFTINVSALTGVFSRLNPQAALGTLKTKLSSLKNLKNFKKSKVVEDDDLDDDDVLGGLGDLDELDAAAAARDEDGDGEPSEEAEGLETPDAANELGEMSMDNLAGDDAAAPEGGEASEGGDAEQEALDALAEMPDFDDDFDNPDAVDDEDDAETQAKKKKVLMLAGGGVAAALVLGVVAFFLMGGDPEPAPQDTADAGLGLVDLPPAPVAPEDEPFTTAPTTTTGALTPPGGSPDLPTSGLKLGGPSVRTSEGQRLMDLGLDFQQEPGVGVVVPSVTKMSFGELPRWPQDAPLEAAPLDALLEQSDFGALPRIAEDGYTPFDAYARPEPRGDSAKPKIAIILTGMGTSRPATEAALKAVPADVSIALDIYARGLDFWVKKARDDGHEVLLTVPMESKTFPFEDPGPAQLRALVSPEENVLKLEQALAQTSGYFGIFADFGSKFLTVEEQVTGVAEQLKARGLMYVDGGAEGSLGPRVAFKAEIPWAAVELRLDDVESTAAIDRQFEELEVLAKKRAQTVARIGNSPLALQRLALWLQGLDARGLRLVPVSALANKQLVR